MIHVMRMLRSRSSDDADAGRPAQLFTPWGEALDPDNVLQGHPHPQFARRGDGYVNLNGWWDYAFAPIREGVAAPIALASARPSDVEVYEGRILVPFSPEAALSGVSRQLRPDELLWYHRTVTVPRLPSGARVLLHFEAVDFACACFCNGAKVGSHEGGYEPFAFDVTEALGASQTAEVVLCVRDPSETEPHLRGKQRLNAGGIWYTAQSGIWQTVWLEVVPARHIDELSVEPDADASALRLSLRLSGLGSPLSARVLDASGAVVCTGTFPMVGTSADVRDHWATVTLRVPAPHLWSPADPYLYRIELRYGDDEVSSYCGFRTVAVERGADGVARLCLNHEPVFLRGLLDQGYWPDGLMTAPSEQAMASDITRARALGFTMLRKHVKVEPDRWYYLCDRLGMLVMQDMVSGGGMPDPWVTARRPTLSRVSQRRVRDDVEGHRAQLGAEDGGYRREWLDACGRQVRRLASHPCVIAWTLFNEGWGQFDAAKATELVRGLDHTRPIDATSGWYDQGCGDFQSVHNYFRTLAVYRDRAAARAGGGPRAFLLSEFGGLTWRVPSHSMLRSSYGYADFRDLASWRQGVRDALAEADALAARGASGFVYTQLTDVEGETNGLLTYDRRVCKLDDDAE